jgi:hypothetical protein
LRLCTVFSLTFGFDVYADTDGTTSATLWFEDYTDKEGHVYVLELAFSDDPARLEARPAHRRLIQELHDQGVVVMAGPFADESGALVIFDVPDREAVDRIIAQDPYYKAPGVTIVSCREWSPIT